MAENNFGQDVDFLREYVETIVLGDQDSAQIAVVPAYQGRTMTSSATGTSGTSYGWINYEQIESRKIDPQINLYGGEDRFWLSPEGGQFSVFFDPGDPLEFSHWRTPALIDTEPFDLVDQSDTEVSFSRRGKIKNYSEFDFHLQFDRRVMLLAESEIRTCLAMDIDQQIKTVGHESHNALTNVGDTPWSPETGLIGIWVLCMNKPSDTATIVVPFREGPVKQLGPIVNADYFGKLDETRLQVDEKRSLIYFLGDGQLRSKLGLTHSRVRPILGSWDASRGALTISQFNLPPTVPHGYTNNLWQIQDNPFAGDVINSYNDGPNESGGMLGPFYELETLSPALALAPGEFYTHVHRTIHLEGPVDKLDQVSQSIFQVGIDEIESQFSSQQKKTDTR